MSYVYNMYVVHTVDHQTYSIGDMYLPTELMLQMSIGFLLLFFVREHARNPPIRGGIVNR